jgi:hypothetical protein
VFDGDANHLSFGGYPVRLQVKVANRSENKFEFKKKKNFKGALVSVLCSKDQLFELNACQIIFDDLAKL